METAASAVPRDLSGLEAGTEIHCERPATIATVERPRRRELEDEPGRVQPRTGAEGADGGRRTIAGVPALERSSVGKQKGVEGNRARLAHESKRTQQRRAQLDVGDQQPPHRDLE